MMKKIASQIPGFFRNAASTSHSVRATPLIERSVLTTLSTPGKAQV